MQEGARLGASGMVLIGVLEEYMSISRRLWPSRRMENGNPVPDVSARLGQTMPESFGPLEAKWYSMKEMARD